MYNCRKGKPMTVSEVLMLVQSHESEAICRTLAMMAFNPSIGRVLEEGGVKKFSDLMVEAGTRLNDLRNQDSFDSYHQEICARIMNEFKTARGEKPSYGQAQKPLNVFLKVYVDWARRPTASVAGTLSPLLHVPLDSLVMKFFKREFPDEYAIRISRVRKAFAESVAKRFGQYSAREVERALFKNEFALSDMNDLIYQSWQEWFRELYPARPVVLDTIWILERA
jgi:hypothetical protein